MITWDGTGERIFETGTDRGVLYPESGPGVPWNGLISVNEKNEGEDNESFYFDGIKYLQMPGPNDFAASVEAFTYPDEFEECDGTAPLVTGVLVTHQPRKQFGMSYRTLVGNDIEGTDYAYKIHLVYNALAAPSEKQRKTLSSVINPDTFTWDLTTTPIDMPGLKPGAHIIIDSRDISPFALEVIEGILYGAEGDPRLPTPEELIDDIPYTARPIWVIATADEDLLPEEAVEGDLVFVIDEEAAYVYGTTPTPFTREVWVLETGDPLPDEALPGDLVYYSDTGVIYRYEGD